MTFVARRVLVVEDEFLVSLGTIDLLESIGCEIVGPAARLAKAVELAQSESLDAAVLDIDIAGELIWPVAEELQYRDVPFLFLSAYPQLGVVPVLFGAAPHLDKPLDGNRLLRHLSAIWERYVEVPIRNNGKSMSQHLPGLPRSQNEITKDRDGCE